MKKINLLIILALGLAAFSLGYLIVGGFVFSSNPSTGTILDKFSEKNTEATASPEPKNIFSITDRKVVSATKSQDGNKILYYEKGTGRVYQYDLTSRIETPLSENILAGFIETIWSPLKTEVISLFGSKAGSEFKYFNFGSKKSLPLNPEVKSVAFSPDGNLIAQFLYSPDSENKIVISQPEGSYPKTLLKTRMEEAKLYWPTKDHLAIKTSLPEIYLLDQNGGLDKFIYNTPYLSERWSLSGNKVLYSFLDPGLESPEHSLFIKDLNTMGERALKILGTASKCAWSLDDKTIYCALARSPYEDMIYSINTEDGSKTLLSDEIDFIIKEIFVSNLEDHLLVISSEDNLYSIRIPD